MRDWTRQKNGPRRTFAPGGSGWEVTPFASVEEIDAELIARWNSIVRSVDEVWHLGDFAFRNAKAVSSYAGRLNGRIHLIWGNYDSQEARACPGGPRRSRTQKSLAPCISTATRTGTLPGDSQSVDVGVDYYLPLTSMAKFESDGHGRVYRRSLIWICHPHPTCPDATAR